MRHSIFIVLLTVMLHSLTGCGGGEAKNDNAMPDFQTKGDADHSDKTKTTMSVQQAKNNYAIAVASTETANFIANHIEYNTFISQIKSTNNKTQDNTKDTSTDAFFNRLQNEISAALDDDPDDNINEAFNAIFHDFMNDIYAASGEVRTEEYNCSLSGNANYFFQKNDTLDVEDNNLSFQKCQTTFNTMYNGKINFKDSQNKSIIQYDHFSVQNANKRALFNLESNMQKTSDTSLHLVINGTKIDRQLQYERVWTFTDWTLDIDNANSDLAVSGKITLQSIPASCADGTYIIETLERIVLDTETDKAISGKIKINNAIYTFNNDGSVTTIINGQPETFSQNNIDIYCDVTHK